MLRRQFHFLASVAEQVPVKQLVMPNDFSALAEVRQAILRDLSEAPGPLSATPRGGY
jgi:hypothetical protein